MVKEVNENVKYKCEICGRTFDYKSYADKCEKSQPHNKSLYNLLGSYYSDWKINDIVLVIFEESDDYDTEDSKFITRLGKITDVRKDKHCFLPIVTLFNDDDRIVTEYDKIQVLTDDDIQHILKCTNELSKMVVANNL